MKWGHALGSWDRNMLQGHRIRTSSMDIKWEHAAELRNGTMLQGYEFKQDHVAGTKMRTCDRDVK